MGTDSAQNRDNGKAFETLFVKQAKFNGLLALKNPLAAQYTYNGRLQPLPGDLDFKLIDHQGNIGYFDCKSFDGESFSYSALKEHQIERAVLYNEWCVPAGFVVCFRASRQVVYFTGIQIKEKGPGNSFEATDGRFIGHFENFDLRKLMPREKNAWALKPAVE